MAALASLLCGLIFGFGLIVSGMTQPKKVLGFLDIFGVWDPTLVFVMAAALAVTGTGFAIARYQGRPLLAAQHQWSTRTSIDAPLVTGAALFGIGWGLVGLCPGPALVNLASLMPGVVVFVLAMAAGIMANDMLRRWRSAADAPANNALVPSSDG